VQARAVKITQLRVVERVAAAVFRAVREIGAVRADGGGDQDAEGENGRLNMQGMELFEVSGAVADSGGEQGGEAGTDQTSDGGDDDGLAEDDSEHHAVGEAENFEDADFTDALADGHGDGVGGDEQDGEQDNLQILCSGTNMWNTGWALGHFIRIVKWSM